MIFLFFFIRTHDWLCINNDREDNPNYRHEYATLVSSHMSDIVTLYLKFPDFKDREAFGEDSFSLILSQLTKLECLTVDVIGNGDNHRFCQQIIQFKANDDKLRKLNVFHQIENNVKLMFEMPGIRELSLAMRERNVDLVRPMVDEYKGKKVTSQLEKLFLLCDDKKAIHNNLKKVLTRQKLRGFTKLKEII